jgi:hypothetical protein
VSGRLPVSRRYADPVDVRRAAGRAVGTSLHADDAPAEFVWRGRLYSVRAVLGHWMEAGGWWRHMPMGRQEAERHLPMGREAERHLPMGRPEAEGHAGPDRGGVVDEGEQEIWRVEARPGRGGSLGVFDLRFDWSGGGWTLARAHD